ncbi:MAG: hypothetical protein M0Q53_17105 [Prolixibacteraceae bacterium]|jgi:hypothetical protein|nr:hypothetical protein [Prolixibacteraceae bacterium]
MKKPLRNWYRFRSILEVIDHLFWQVAETPGGLNKFDRGKETFQNFPVWCIHPIQVE